MKKALEEQVAQLEGKLDHFSNIEDTLNKSIVVAQEAAEEVKRNAQKEAKLIVREAEKNADRIINEALVKSRKVAFDIEELKKQAKVFRTRFRMLLETQLEMLNNDDWDKLIELEDEVDELLKKKKQCKLDVFSLLHIILNNIFIKKNEDRDKYLFIPYIAN